MKKEILHIVANNRNYYKKYLTPEHFIFLNELFGWTKNLKEQIFCLRNDIYEQPKCKYSPCDNHANFKGMTEGYGAGGCCRKHGQFISNLENYGYEMPFNSTEILQKCKSTILKNHGVENPMKIKSISIKSAITRKNYSPGKKELCATKRKKTCREKFGYDNLFENVEFIKYRVSIKHGVENVMQVPSIAEKSLKHSLKYKTFIWKSGEVSKVQGNEPIILRELEENGYLFDEVKTNRSDMPEIWYSNINGKRSKYYPDIFIPHENLIIEVKSKYTASLNVANNLLKFEAVKQLGFDFKLEIRD